MRDKLKNQYQPDSVSPPGSTLAETLEAIGMSQAELADRTDRPKKTINEIVQGKAAITPETALQFEKALGIPADFWNERERRYREYLARAQEKTRFQKHLAWLKEFPLSMMIRFGWIEKKSDELELMEALLRFFGVSSPRSVDDLLPKGVSFRQAYGFEQDKGACAAWLRKGVIEAQHIQCENYDEGTFSHVLIEVRRLTCATPEVFSVELPKLCAKAGVAVVFVPELPRIRVSGATRWLGSDKAMIQLCLRYKTNDQLWFTFFHEAGHITLHGRREIFIEKNGDKTPKEKEADRFAADVLIPKNKYKTFAEANRFGRSAVVRFSEQLGVAPAIVVGRLQHDGLIPFNHLNDLKQRLMWSE